MAKWKTGKISGATLKAFPSNTKVPTARFDSFLVATYLEAEVNHPSGLQIPRPWRGSVKIERLSSSDWMIQFILHLSRPANSQALKGFNEDWKAIKLGFNDPIHFAIRTSPIAFVYVCAFLGSLTPLGRNVRSDGRFNCSIAARFALCMPRMKSRLLIG